MTPSTTASTGQLVLFGVIAAICAVQWRPMWSGRLDAALDRGLRPVWPCGEHSRRGFTRAGPLALVVLFTASVVMLLHASVVVENIPMIAVAAEWLGAAVVVPGCFVIYTIIAFNRPRFIVAPHRRAELGAVEAARAEREERQRREWDRT